MGKQVDSTNYSINRKTSIIEHREINKVNQSIIDSYTSKLRKRLHDDTLDERFVAKIIQNLSEKDIEDFADYSVRKARIPGRAFVKLCYNAMHHKNVA